MGSFGSLSVAGRFTIVFVCSVFLIACGAGFLKLRLNRRRRVAKATATKALQTSARGSEKERLVPKKLNSGDFLEAGYFGGMPQSGPNSPAFSPPLSPFTGNPYYPPPLHSPSNGGNSSVDILGSAENKISPLQPPVSDTKLGGRSEYNPTIAGLYTPPLPALRGVGSEESDPKSTWVSPLDVHFSRPSTPTSTSRPTLNLPQPGLTGGVDNNTLFVPAPESIVKSDPASVISTEPSSNSVGEKSPDLPTLPPTAPSITVEQSSPRATSPTSNVVPSRDALSEQSPRKDPIPPPPVHDYFISQAPNAKSYQPEIQWQRAVIRDSIASKKQASMHRPERPRSSSPPSIPQRSAKRNRGPSVAASSMYSNTSSTPDSSALSNSDQDQRQSCTTSRSTESKPKPMMRPTPSHTRSSSDQSLGRSQNSLHRHPENLSEDKRGSKDRDQMGYDPSNQKPNRSGSIEGQRLRFDRPGSTTFGGSGAHPACSSSSPDPETSLRGTGSEQVKTTPFETTTMDRIGVGQQGGMNRSGSDASQGSIGDFYDAYYRRSTIGQRTSIVNQGNQEATNGQETLNASNVEKSVPPVPFQFGLAAVKIPNPMLSPTLTGFGGEGYPAMI